MGSRATPDDRAQHHHPGEEVADLLDRGGQPARGRHRGLPGRAPDLRQRQQAARQLPPRRHRAGPARHAADRGDLRHRRQRHPHVTATDKKTNKEQKISIEGSSGLSDDEIEKAKREAEEHAEEDKKRCRGPSTQEQGRAHGLRGREAARGAGDKLPEELKSGLDGAEGQGEVRDLALKSDDAEKSPSSRRRGPPEPSSAVLAQRRPAGRRRKPGTDESADMPAQASPTARLSTPEVGRPIRRTPPGQGQGGRRGSRRRRQSNLSVFRPGVPRDQAGAVDSHQPETNHKPTKHNNKPNMASIKPLGQRASS